MKEAKNAANRGKWFRFIGRGVLVVVILSTIPVCVHLLRLWLGPDVSTKTWAKTFITQGRTYARAVQQTSDGGYIVAGETWLPASGSDSATDMYLLKLDADGNEQWSKTFGGKGQDMVLAVQQTSDGGYILAGDTQISDSGSLFTTDAFLGKVDANGNELWSRTYGGEDSDGASAVLQTSEGGYIIAGYMGSATLGATSDHDMYLGKIDANGKELWSKTFDFTDSEMVSAMQPTSDGGYILAGSAGITTVAATSEDMCLVKTDANGAEQWSRTFGGEKGDRACAVQQTSDGGYILAGESITLKAQGQSWVSEDEAYIVKTHADGKEQWSRVFARTTLCSAHSVKETSDGGYVLAGEGSGGMSLMKIDANGDEVWTRAYGGVLCGAMQQTTDGGYIVAGDIVIEEEPPFECGVYVVKTDAKGRAPVRDPRRVWRWPWQ